MRKALLYAACFWLVFRLLNGLMAVGSAGSEESIRTSQDYQRRYDTMMAESERQLKRMDTLMGKQEENARRFEAVLTLMEQAGRR